MSSHLTHEFSAGYNHVMTDAEILDDLAEKVGGIKLLASELKVSRQTLWDWRTRQISPLGRFILNGFAKKRRFKLPDDFMERAE